MKNLYEKFLKNLDVLGIDATSKVVIALSGGVDSTCLMDLCAKTFDKSKIIAITVDHKLRACSSEEALGVSKICKKYCIKHVILNWDHEKINSNVQDKARKARYNLISEYCKSDNIQSVLTAHHLDDRVENFFIKLSRGSGLMGLLDRETSEIFGIKIIRPLFNILKDEIIEYAKENNLVWFEDESNSSDKYLRNDIRNGVNYFLDRKHIDKNLFKRRIAMSQDNLGDFAEVVTEYFEEKYKKHVSFHQDNDGEYFLIRDINELSHRIILHMILEKVLTSINKTDKKIRSSSISEIIYNLAKNFKKTLHKCIVIHKNNVIKVKSEF